MDYETFKETLETFMNAETLIYSGITAGAALLTGAASYLKGKSRASYKIRMAEIERDRTLAMVDQRKAEVELEKIQAQIDPELERVKGENERAESQIRLEQIAKESESEISSQRAEYELEQKRREYDDGLKIQRAEEDARMLTRRLEARKARIEIIAERLGERLEQYIQALREYGKTDGQADDPFKQEREKFKQELADKLIESLNEDYTIRDEEYCANDDDEYRLDGLARLKFPYQRTQETQRKPLIEPSKEMRLLLKLVGKRIR